MNGDRLCDTTQPGGYCTVFNCEPDTCPEEAQCIAFDTELDPSCVDQSRARFERTFCMRRCSNDGDCRSGYECLDMSRYPNAWGARVADLDPEGTKVCISPSSGAPQGGATEVCGPYDGDYPDAESVAPIGDWGNEAGDDADDAETSADADDSAVEAGEDAL